ncbi:hypothetical protein Clacol_003169 [Clathrus columnatus]|uniref:Non-haem dioxygenase N-terminal domain-containing protein n=1 Tax=Clathrus columnatus TaxID=1419009 RepID=A0AAV5A882_9AGAM|nr:hypothetical protein Clacol_003169 [Clathrus columnatus]
MPVPVYPPLPDNVPTHPLVVIDYELIRARDPIEIERLWEAATSLGFCLMNHGADKEVNDMFDLGAKYMALPFDEKMEFTQGQGGSNFGYKHLASIQIDPSGTRDANEYFNIAQDDAFSYPSVTHRTYPTLINDAMQPVITPFTRKSVEVNNTLIDVFNDRLGLPADELGKRHDMTELSGNGAKFIRVPPNLNTGEKAVGHHTDFGSLTFLHNRLGGLQVLSPDTGTWQYIKARNSVLLNALSKESSLIKAAVDRAVDPKVFNTGATALEWLSRRVTYRRAVNQKDPQLWTAGQGTEGKAY